MTIRLIVACLFAACCMCAPAQAHRPYLTHKTPWLCADGKLCSLAVLNGDGIFFPDPNRPVILNEDGKVIAIGPLDQNPLPFCVAADDCKFITDAGAYAPDPATFGTPREPNFYPEHLDQYRDDYSKRPAGHEFKTYGMTMSSISPSYRLWVWKTVLASSPIITVALLLSGANLGWRNAKPRGPRSKVKAPISPGVASAILGGLIVLLASHYYIEAAILLFLAVALAAFVARKAMS